MPKLKENWKKILSRALKECGIINDDSKNYFFTVVIDIKYNGVCSCEIKHRIK